MLAKRTQGPPGDREERVRLQYESWLAGHTPVALYVRWYLRHAGARYAEQLFGAMGAGPFRDVLDVGCATGFYLKWAFDHGHGRRTLAGVDLSSTLVSEASERLRFVREAGVDVQLRIASATKLPFPDQSFDALICNGVVKYLDDDMLSAFLAEATRVLRWGGRIAIADFGRPVVLQSAITPPVRYGIPVDHLRSSEALCEVLTDHGFEGVGPVAFRRIRRIPLTYEGAVGVIMAQDGTP